MPQFLFQPDPINGYDFNPIPIDIHLGIIRIPTEEILDDDAINNTESMIVGTDRSEVLNRIQTACIERGAEVNEMWLVDCFGQLIPRSKFDKIREYV